MEIVEQRTGKITVVQVKGRIDSNTAKAFCDKLTSLINAHYARLVVDLQNIDYITSAGFRALLMADKLTREINGAVVLCGLSAEVRKLFETGSFTDFFAIYPSRDKAVARLSARHAIDLWNDPTDRNWTNPPGGQNHGDGDR